MEWDGKLGASNVNVACWRKPRSASYGRVFLGAIVPDAESDLGCGDRMLGGEMSLKRAKLDPVGEIV